MFFKGSRYEKVQTVRQSIAGREVVYKKTRFIRPPRAEQSHIVSDGDRLDLIADRYLKDSERFWRICDSASAQWPPELIGRPGRRIGIPASEE